VRLRHVEELVSELVISQNQYWGRHRSEVEDEPVASLEDLEWADGVAFGTPTRFGNVAAQLKQFMDQAGGLWQEGKLADKVATAFTASMTTHGGAGVDDPCPQQHPLPLGHAHPPARLHGERGVQRRWQPVWHLVHEREEGRGSRQESTRGSGAAMISSRRPRAVDVSPKPVPQGTVVGHEPRAAGWMALGQAVQEASPWATELASPSLRGRCSVAAIWATKIPDFRGF
jgi:NADPH-dependent FMN reductase